MMSPVIRSRDIEAGAHRLRLYESGDRTKPPVLWLHGSGPGVSAMANWRQLVTDLAPAFYNIAPDVLGFGDSSCPDPFPRGVAASVELRAENLLALLDALELDTVDVVGNSMGGMYALRIAQIAPRRLRKIVLMGSGGAGSLTPEAAAKAGRFIANPTLEGMRELLQMFVYDAASFGVDLNKLAEERMASAARPDIARVNAATYDHSKGPLVFKPEELAAIRHPALVIHGREDRVIAVDQSYILAAQMPDAQLHVFPHCGHWAQLEQPRRFASLIDTFLSDAL
jgi:2-hydroxymuconate-semialdehyde hydrolase